jgi:hypothetical protein
VEIKEKKCEKKVPVKKNSSFKIKGTTIIPAAPLVIAGHTYIPVTVKADKSVNKT